MHTVVLSLRHHLITQLGQHHHALPSQEPPLHHPHRHRPPLIIHPLHRSHLLRLLYRRRRRTGASRFGKQHHLNISFCGCEFSRKILFACVEAQPIHCVCECCDARKRTVYVARLKAHAHEGLVEVHRLRGELECLREVGVPGTTIRKGAGRKGWKCRRGERKGKNGEEKKRRGGT